MKTRDIIGAVIALAIIIVTGTIFYTQLAPVPKGTGIVVEVPPKLNVPLSSDVAKKQRDDMRALQDYARPQEIRVCSGDSDKGCIGKNGIFQP